LRSTLLPAPQLRQIIWKRKSFACSAAYRNPLGVLNSAPREACGSIEVEHARAELVRYALDQGMLET
jgi:hypothetical protein